MKRTIFIGQAMPRAKRDLHDWPTLNNWFFSIGLTYDQIVANFYYSALVDYFPGAKAGSHLVPTPADILAQRPRLQQNIRDFNPQLVVPVGSLSISYCLQQSVAPLTVHIGNIYTANPYGLLGTKLPIIPLPHPSGASTWRHIPAHKLLLHHALSLLKSTLQA